MLNFTPVKNKEMSWPELVEGLTREDLIHLTDEMVDEMQRLIADCTDADVVFVPEDPQANDTYAGADAEVNLPWTLGHVIVHTTASAEESAFLAAELARGVPVEARRSRSEVDWQTVTTIAQCRARLEESRRMRLASLQMWPTVADLTNYYESRGGLQITAVLRFVLGLSHDDSHLGQIAAIVQQAQDTHQPV
jgi:hypothetical protein